MSSRKSDAWIFVSHSNNDLFQVRHIRNEVERLGANPILFFLKQTIDDELLRIFLKNEIKARNFFILCDSENARASEFVQFEVEYVKSLTHVKWETVDLDSGWKRQQKTIENLLSEATIFISYTSADRPRIQPYIDYLASEEFAVFDPISSLKPGQIWQQAIQDAINEASRFGYFVQFLSQKSLQNPYLVAEFNYYLGASGGTATGRQPILIALEPLNTLILPANLTQYQIIDATRQLPDRKFAELKHALGL